MAQRLMPAPGAIPKIPGTDIYGMTIPFNGIAGGDLITYVNFQERFDLDARIRVAASQGQDASREVASEAQTQRRHPGRRCRRARFYRCDARADAAPGFSYGGPV